MNKQIVVTALVVWLLVSFVPALSAAKLAGKVRGGGKSS